MRFDWITFLRNHNIPFIESGPNVSKGNVNIHCPFCGAADSSHHLGISLAGRGWGCWRAATHRGKSKARLIAALLGCSLEEAQRIAGGPAEAELGQEASFGDDIAALLGEAPEQAPSASKTPLRWMPEMRPLRDGGLGAAPFFNYLTSPDRDYRFMEAVELAELYDLRMARTGAFAYRLMIPIEMPGLGLVNWTGRSIRRDAVPRYKTLSTKPGKGDEQGLPLARRVITDCLWNYAALSSCTAETLVVVEGPFDALRIDYFGDGLSMRATCLFGKNMSKEQAYLLGEISERYKRKILLLDRDASLDAFALNESVAHFGFKVHTISDQKDPALFSPSRVRSLKSLL